MRLKRLKVELVPHDSYNDATKLEVEVELVELADVLRYNLVLPDDHFKTKFDYAWEVAKRELDNFIEQNRS